MDIETYSRTRKPNPANDKIITIQFQELSTREGRPEGKLEILTEWDFKSERNMLNVFRRKFITDRDFDFISVGENLYGFDLISLFHRLNKYFHLELGMDFFRDRPVIDIKSSLVMMNEGNFRDYQRVLGKKSGHMVRQWYDAKDYDKIERYVRREARNFIAKYQILKKRMLEIRF